jgi:hypothetical protein
MKARLLPGKATHFKLPGTPTACGRVGVAFHTEDAAKVDCRQCARALRALRKAVAHGT